MQKSVEIVFTLICSHLIFLNETAVQNQPLFWLIFQFFSQAFPYIAFAPVLAALASDHRKGDLKSNLPDFFLC